MGSIQEADLPGIGKKFIIDDRSGDRIVIIVHDDGVREIHHFCDYDPEESLSMVTLDDSESRRVGAILGGMVYMPKALESVDVAFDEMVIEWFKVEPDAKVIGKTIGELEIRKKTNATIIALITKEHQKIVNPGPEQIIMPGATIVVLGERGQIKASKTLINTGDK